MLEIRKTAISLDEQELLELERIITDGEEKEALIFLKKSVYEKIVRSQKGKLKSHLDTGGDPVERFKMANSAWRLRPDRICEAKTKEDSMNLLTKATFCSLILILILSCGIICACSGPAKNEPIDTQEPPTLQNGVEVVYFHRARRCSPCVYAENCVTYAVETYFQEELASGELVFKILNVQDEANAVMIEKYGAYGSSLFINEVIDGIDHIEHVTDIWFVVGDDEACVSTVKGEIEEHLGE